ncbi:DUF4349 domain-containing protein [Hymenobacter cellulosivorans]|uniref:DUF4349 domain-containing protein n=1 Tax=Hymenobacter cellulosivorans TaxID=2932249 RepID=A0ABY4F6Y4_9BACT|nr:DUF4349 domain-containing protein [Hymenobacter cellulosivorans]UOQ52432.1 DUF4349 domain-containing protein [Hymenobacter cellulosivorans]
MYFPNFLAVRRWVATLLLSGSVLPALAQSGHDQELFETQKRLTVGVTKFAEARTSLKAFIGRRAVWVQKQEETPDQLTAEFALPTRALDSLDSLATGLGFVLENNLNAQNLTSRLQDLGAEEKVEAAQLARVEKELQAGRLGETERQRLEAELERHTSSLTRLRQRQQSIQSHAGQAYVTLRLYDEVSFPTGNRKVSFVNMPGVEYSYLRLDNPKPGLTSRAYQGYAIKYMFTRGKSYFNLGVYKPVEKADEPEFVNELFVINFGQDFYPRNFGRGRRKFLNLYTSYQIGGFILNRNNDEQNEFIPNLNLGLGVELIKTRHILLDTKASYFVPLYDHSRDLRGILGQASFNFVF